MNIESGLHTKIPYKDNAISTLEEIAKDHDFSLIGNNSNRK